MADFSDSKGFRDSIFCQIRLKPGNKGGEAPCEYRLRSGRPTSIKKIILLFLLFLVFMCWKAGFPNASDVPVGRLINPQGSVTVLPSGEASWEEAKTGRDLFAGDAVKTGQDSRVSILCIDETQLKLNENTIVVLKGSAPSPRMGFAVPATQKDLGSSLYEVPAGEIWLRNKNEKAQFGVETPAVTATIRGTEFNLKVDRDGATDLVLLEGRLSLANPQGQIDLDPGEEGFAEVGRAPVKRVILQPKDAVQWSLYYPGIFSYRDIPLGGTSEDRDASPMIRKAMAGYDRGDLGGSEREANEALAQEPENTQALVILGWISLQRQDPQKATAYFERARKAAGPQPVSRLPSVAAGLRDSSADLTLCGLALAGYRTGDAVGAYKLMAAELKQAPPSSLMLVMSGYFSMLVGKIEQAKALLTDSRISGRESAIAHSLLSQIYLVQNSKEQASSEAATALQLNSESPMVRMTSALVKISYFDLPAARRLLEESLAADPHFLEAYVYLARLWLGADYLDRAWEVIGKALEISKTDSEVLSLAGFIRLGYRDFDKAFKLFTEAVKNDPGFGEPHIGLANIAFRNRNFSLGLTEMLTATLLEPRVSLYQSSLGKALYQTRSFDKALEVYDYAKTLDPNDPTPYLYKGIALTDLYRPGEAIQEINKSIELNDNMAVFRTRLMLDRDLAVRNTDLSRAYNQLGLVDWAYSKALTAVKNDPLNPSAHLFLSSQFMEMGDRSIAATSEFLQYRLLAPANENTFTGETYTLTKDYTPMFEMPYAKLEVSAGIGTWADHEAPVQDHFIEVYGGWPGLALDAYGIYQNDPGFRKINDDAGQFYGSIEGKFEPTIKDSFYAAYSYDKSWSGDNSYSDDFSFMNDPYQWSTSNSNSVESGYVHRFSPSAVFIGYFNWYNESDHITDTTVYPFYFDNMYWHYIQDYNNVQLQQRLKLGDHTLIGGFDYFTGPVDYFYYEWYSFSGGLPPLNIVKQDFETLDRETSVYVRDYWRICPQLLVELGISGDFMSSSRFGFPYSISSSTANPLVGLNYEIDKSNTLRFAYQGYVSAHSIVPSIAPSEVAGFPSMINAGGFDGSKVKELGFAWESQWNPLTFTVFRLTANRIDDPQFVENPNIIDWRIEHFDGSFTVNRLLTSSLGLSAGVAGKIVSMGAPVGIPSEIFATGNFNEISGNVALSYMHPSGWFASIKDTVVHQDLGGLSDPFDTSVALHQKELGDPFNLVDITFGKYFANKRGYAQLAITNVFNQHFCYETEIIALDQFYPDREIIFRVGLYF
jgi:tetratricopeptide (TPR) repeat protein